MALPRPSPLEVQLYNMGAPERLAYILGALMGLNGSLAQAVNFHGSALAAANQDAAAVVAAPVVLNGYEMGNTAAYWVYVKFYDQAGSPTSADVPVRRVALPPGGGISRSNLSQGFATKMWTRCTKGLADNDATACVAGDCTFSIDYTVS